MMSPLNFNNEVFPEGSRSASFADFDILGDSNYSLLQHRVQIHEY